MRFGGITGLSLKKRYYVIQLARTDESVFAKNLFAKPYKL